MMPFHILTKKVFTLVHTVSQSVPNQLRKVSAMPFSIFRTEEKTPLIPFQIPEKISFTPVHT